MAAAAAVYLVGCVATEAVLEEYQLTRWPAFLWPVSWPFSLFQMVMATVRRPYSFPRRSS